MLLHEEGLLLSCLVLLDLVLLVKHGASMRLCEFFVRLMIRTLSDETPVHYHFVLLVMTP